MTRRSQFLGYLFLFPALLFFALFSWYPILRGFLISFQKFPIRADMPPSFVGFENFHDIWTNPLFWLAWKNVLLFVILALVIGYFTPIILAITMNETRHARSFFRISYYLPAILPIVVTAIMWRWFYNPDVGLANQVLGLFHIPKLQLLQSERTALASLVVMATWTGAGSTALIYLAGLQGLPEELYEAAEIDGASIFQRIRFITIPQMSSVMLIILLLQLIGTFQVFTEPLIMTAGGGPNNATLTILLLIYRTAFIYVDFGTAAAMSLVLFIALLVLTLIYFKVTKRFEMET